MKKISAIIILLLFGISHVSQVQASVTMNHAARDIATGDVKSLKSTLKLFPAAIKTRDGDERTLLHYCADRSIIPVRFSIRRSEKLEQQDHDKWRVKSKEMTELLLSHGADANAKDVFSQTPLYYAAITGNAEVAKALLAHGADVRAGSRSYSSTPLHMAALHGHTSVARLLIENGADVNAQDAFGAPLNMALGRDMVILLLENHADAEIRNKDGFAPLHLAEDLEIAQILISHGAKLDTKGFQGRTPLHQAAMRNENKRVEWLCTKGAPVNALDAKGQTPLMLSLSVQGYGIDAETRTETVRILVKYGADLNCRDDKGWTLLHYAVRENNTDMVDLFVSKGMDINARDKYGYTPLYWAVTNKSKKMVEALVLRGADVNARNLQGNTPLHETWGGSAVDIQIADILKSRGGTR